MTLILRMKNTINNPSAPKLIRVDPVENRAGSLFLWDAGRTQLSSVPAIDASLPNLLTEYPLASDKLFTFIKGSTSQAEHDSYLKRELTAKGGIHWIASQSRATDLLSGTTFFGIKANTALKTYLANKIMGSNPAIFISIWTNTTRYVTKTAGYAPMLAYVNGGTSNVASTLLTDKRSIEIAGAITNKKTLSKLNLTQREPAIQNTPNYYQAVIDSYLGVGITTSNDLIIGNGQIPPWGGSTSQALNSSPSYILYRVYIEDLSLSGRTFDQVRAIDEAEHAKAFSVGGRFHGDTWSNPATLLP